MGTAVSDELSLAVPYEIFTRMPERFGESFLMTKTWSTVQKKIELSRKPWGEEESEASTRFSGLQRVT